MQGGTNPCGGGVSDATAIFVAEQIPPVMNGAFDDPVAPAQIQQILGRTVSGGSTTHQVQKAFLLMLVAQVIAMPTQQEHLLAEEKAHLFGGDRQDSDLMGFHASMLFTHTRGRRGEKASTGKTC